MDAGEGEGEGEGEVNHEIVIVGGGICGLATALALHRKGVSSVVLERSETLRASGAAIGIMSNGWRALHQLGVDSILKQTSIRIQGLRDIWLDKGKEQEASFMNGEARCLKRIDLIKSLADALPSGTIHFGCQIVSLSLDPQTSFPILQLQDGSSIVAKVLIGCDGVKSVIADFLDVKPTKLFTRPVVRGLTNYPNGHAFTHELVRMRRENILIGRVPVDNQLVYWFVIQQFNQTGIDAKVSQDPELIRRSTLESVSGFPPEIIEMIKGTDLDSLSLTHLRYRAPWDLLLGRFRKGTVTVAGDAMHVMGPFLGQGGSAGLEDAIVLARSLAQKTNGRQIMVHEVEEALDQYVRERRMRVVKLSTQTYLTGLPLETSSLLVKFTAIIFMAILFPDRSAHAKYNCGSL